MINQAALHYFFGDIENSNHVVCTERKQWSKRCVIIIFWCPVFLGFLLLSYICMLISVTGMNTWMNNWQRNDWTTASGGEVKNRADFERLNHASQGMNVTYVSELT